MKRLYLLLFSLAVFAWPLSAQGPDAGAAARMAVPTAADPSARAMRESQRLQKELGLNDKQTKKVYKLFYKHFKKSSAQTPGFGGPGGMGHGPGGMGHGPGGMRPGSGGPGMGGSGGPGLRGGMPSQSGSENHAGMRSDGELQQADTEAPGKENDAWRKLQSKKFRKIFTAEQYAAWEQLTSAQHPEGPQAAKPGDPAKPDGASKPEGPAVPES